jgi:hypothetical protein
MDGRGMSIPNYNVAGRGFDDLELATTYAQILANRIGYVVTVLGGPAAYPVRSVRPQGVNCPHCGERIEELDDLVDRMGE